MQGYIIEGGQSGCIPDASEYARLKHDAEATARDMRHNGMPEVDIVTADYFAECNSVETLDEVFALLEA